MSVNKVILVGNVGRDPMIRYTTDNVVVANFSLATNEYYKDNSGNLQKITEWHTIVAWRNLAELAEKYIKKGSQIYVEGRIRSRTYTDVNQVQKTVVEIIADTIQLLGKKEEIEIDENTQQASVSGTPEGNVEKDSSKEINEKEGTSKDINTTLSEDNPSDDLPF